MGNISTYLEQDHARCHAMYLDAVASVAARDWVHAGMQFGRFAHALRRHLAMEEDIVFSAFEAAIGTDNGPTRELRTEHQYLRGMLERLMLAIERAHAAEFFDRADTFRIVLQQHSSKEEGIIYPMADRVLYPHRGDIVAAMAAARILDPAET